MAGRGIEQAVGARGRRSQRNVSRRVRRVLAQVIAVAAVAALLPLAVTDESTVDAAPAPDGLFVRGADAVELGSQGTVYAKVVTDGRGTFHSITRVNYVIGQYIQYRRSTDSGRTWQLGGMFAGPSGGATRPEIAVDGDHVAIVFIGARCGAGDLCEEVPMLVTSDSAGLGWTSPIQLSPDWGTDMAVAQSGDQTWVAWYRPNRGAVAVRRITGGTATLSEELPGWSSPMVKAWGNFALFGGSTRNGAVVAAAINPGGLGLPQALPGGLQDIAIADNRGHALLRTQGAMSVASFDVYADVAISPSTPVVIGTGDVWSGKLDARRGLLVATWTTTQLRGRTSSAQAWAASSKDGGATFGAPTLVADNPSAADLTSFITIGTSVGDAPIATFNWKVEEKYVDGPDQDDLPEPANVLGSELDRFAIDRSSKVTLDGCASIAAPGRTIPADGYSWAVDGSTLEGTGCSITTDLPANQRYKVTLSVTDSTGEVGQTEMTVVPKDLLVVSIGDSVASGEGSPHRDAVPAIRHSETWQDQACHRSAYAGPALAARKLEREDEHSSVTFVQLACSGASIMDVPEVPGGEQDPTDDPESGGLVDGYAGVEPLGAAARPSQLDQLDALRGSRTVDALMVSIGANDVKFSEVVKECLITAPGEFASCTSSSTRTRFDTRIATLPNRYSALAARLNESGIEPSDVYITEYFDQTTDEFGMPNLRCVAGEALDAATSLLSLLGPEVEFFINVFLAGGLITDDEARFARDHVGPQLNAQVNAAAARHGWNYVGGIASQFFKHGYCSESVASPSWVVGVGESITTQHDEFGSFHPNRDGQKVYGDALFRDIRSDLVLSNAEAIDETLTGDLVGDVYVLAGTNHRLSAVALRDGGTTLVPVGARQLVRVDTTIDPSAMVGVTSPIAASGLDAVAVWNEGWTGWGFYRTAASPVAIVDNVTVRNARVVQAPIDSTKLLAGRQLLVAAGVNGHIEAATNAKVRTVVTDDTGVLFDQTETVRIEPGDQTLLLPASGALTSTGTTVDATVTIEPLAGEPITLHADNEAVAPTATVSAGRALKLTIVPMNTMSSGAVSCSQAATTASAMLPFTEAVLPVTGVESELGCTPPTKMPSTQLGIYIALLELDEYAQLTGRDAVVGVVPDGWLSANAGGAVGISASGLRAMLVERSADRSTMAHEFAHTWGIDHINDAPAGGAWVAQRRAVRGLDLMNERVVPKPWVGRSTWERLLSSLGGPGDGPSLPDFTATNVIWLRGYVVDNGDGTFSYAPGRWQGPDDATYVGGDDDDLEELEVERLLAVQVDTDTGVATSVPIDLAGVGALLGSGAAGPAGLPAQTFAQRLALAPTTDRVDIVLDGDVVESRTVSANAPTVTVTAPVTGTVVGSNEQVEVTWDGIDLDGDALTYSILLSPDGGTTWQPVASGISGSSYSFDSPEDVDSQNAVVRVIASDGLRSGHDDSDAFGVLTSIVTDPPRVVFVQHQRVNAPNTYKPTIQEYRTLGQPGMGLFTMAPDGTDVQPLVPYTLPLEGSPYSPLRPFWNADATKVAFDAMTASGTRQLFVVDRDGTGLRKVTSFDNLVCASWHPDGTKLLTTDTFDGSLRVIDVATGASLANLGVSKVREWDERAGCPRWSPDGTRIVVMRDVSDTRGGLALADAEDGRSLFLTDGFFGGFTPIFSRDGARMAAQSVSGCQGFIIYSTSTLREVARYGGNTDQPYQLCYGSMGYASDNELWFTSSYVPWPTNYTDVSCSFFCTFRPAQDPVGRFCTAPITPNQNVPTCYLPNGTGTPVSPSSTTESVGIFQADFYPGVSEEQEGTGPVVIPPPPSPASADAGGPYTGIVGEPVQFDAGASTALLGEGATSTVTWDLDGDGSFDDATGVAPLFGYEVDGTYQVSARVTTAGGSTFTSAATTAVIAPLPVVEPVVLEDAAAPPIVEAVPPADIEVTVSMDSPTDIQLQLTDGATTEFVVDASGLPDGATVSYPIPVEPWDQPSTDQGGVVTFTPPTGFLGRLSFTYTRSDGASAVVGTVTVDVVGNRVPTVGTDTVSVTRGAVVSISPAALLANDVDPDPPARALRAFVPGADGGLSVVNVVSGTNTAVWMDPDGTIRLRLDGATGDFAYLVSDSLGGIGMGSVTVRAAATPTTTTSPATTAPTTTRPPAPSTTAGQSSPVTTEPGSFGLPETGSDVVELLRAAFWIALLGAGVVVVTRRRRRSAE